MFSCANHWWDLILAKVVGEIKSVLSKMSYICYEKLLFKVHHNLTPSIPHMEQSKFSFIFKKELEREQYT